MGATESKAQGNGAGAGEGSSKAKLTFAQGTQPLQSTPVYTLRDAFYGKRPVSAFTYDPAHFALDNKQEFLPKAIKKLKTIRHPSVLRFIDCKTSSAGVHLVTEQVVPLTTEYLEEMTEDEILVGLYDIMVALHFLHSQCHISHNNVQLGSIFVSNGRWVLGGMEFTGTVAELMEVGLTSVLSKELVPPEHQGQPTKMNSRDMDLAHAVDIWQYGRLVETLIQDGLLHIKPNALPIDRMLNNDPRKRPPGDVIIESDLFTHNNAVAVVRYCRLKGLDKVQNAEWNQTIIPKLQLLPPSIMEKIILPQLLTQEFFAAEGFDKLYMVLFTPQPPQPLVSEEVYRSQVIPFMVKLWSYRQADIRLTILRLFEVYLKAVVLGEGGSEVLGQIILPEILAGLQDADPKVYLASLCGLATAIPYTLLVTTLVDTDLTKQKFSVKSLYEQTLIPQIMAFWISEDSTQESKVQLVEVVMGMWCSIYTLGLHNHLAVKDMSATLTLTLVSVLKLSPVSERVELISKSFTKHCTNGLFCISGLLKFLPQFLLDEDQQVREAAARVISTVAHQTTSLVPQSESTAEQQENLHPNMGDIDHPIAPSSPSNQSVHVSRIRQYCEKQQSLLPPRRPIFSRSAFANERSLSSSSLRNYNGVENKASSLTLDLHSSRRSSIVSQDSFMYSEQGSLKTPSLLTPSLTRSGSFSADPSSRDMYNNPSGLDPQSSRVLEKGTQPLNRFEDLSLRSSQTLSSTNIEDATEEREGDLQASEEIELMKALEAAKAEMKMRQIPSITKQPVSRSNSSNTSLLGSGVKTSTAAPSFGWDDGDDADDWGNDDLTTLNSPSSTLEQPVEDEATRLKREREMNEKQEQLRLKRDQKQQEMQAKREARRQQLAEKQEQKKGSSNSLKLGAVKAGSPLTSAASTPSVAAPKPTPVSAPVAAPVVMTPKPVSGRSMIQLPVDEKDDWGMDDDIDMSALNDQPSTVEDELFKDLEVTYKAPVYVGSASAVGLSGSTTSISSSASSMTLSNHGATSSTTKTTTTTTTTKTTTVQSPATSSKSTTTATLTTTSTSTNSMSLKSAGSQSRGSSPFSTPKRVASPLLRTPSNGSLNNSSNDSNGGNNGSSIYSSNGHSEQSPNAATSPVAIVPETSPTLLEKTVPVTATATTPPPTTKVASSLAPQVDEEALDADAWGDDWE
ncbi:Protein-associating with the carboxyl-terminal domain of ezrin [Entomortierella chlamydospora]|nr:Protein-associating with the carboxyl-terminal domain of ezrin [Entomortierella chlamydospora]